MGVIVIGSANQDTAVAVHRHPGPGETVLATAARSGAGGKGLNQAIAAVRCGADTLFVGSVGVDEAGARLSDVLETEGARVMLGRSENPTGSAFVMVADGGENAIVVAPGANRDADTIGREARRAMESASAADIVLAQLEVPIEAVLTSFRAAKDRGITTMLNAAPSAQLPEAMLDAVDILVVNQHECVDLAGEGTIDVEEAAFVLAGRVQTLVVTLGDAGAIVRVADNVTRVAAFRVDAVDTTAAGDTFCGTLAARLSAGDDLAAAVQFASAAAALCVQRHGAAASAPYLSETRAFLAACRR